METNDKLTEVLAGMFTGSLTDFVKGKYEPETEEALSALEDQI